MWFTARTARVVDKVPLEKHIITISMSCSKSIEVDPNPKGKWKLFFISFMPIEVKYRACSVWFEPHSLSFHTGIEPTWVKFLSCASWWFPWFQREPITDRYLDVVMQPLMCCSCGILDLMILYICTENCKTLWENRLIRLSEL